MSTVKFKPVFSGYSENGAKFYWCGIHNQLFRATHECFDFTHQAPMEAFH